ncbi:hypothetical protein EC919_117118 [Pseudomonas graminis]|nr:hypothetical protein EC919_117118 [Pseudomonas graminis]
MPPIWREATANRCRGCVRRTRASGLTTAAQPIAGKRAPTVDFSLAGISASCTKPVGAGLLAKAVCQSKWTAQVDRIRGQARSHSGFSLAEISASCIKPVGDGLLAKTVCQSKWMAQVDRLRGQARSCSGFRWPGFQRHAQNLWEPACWRRRCVSRMDGTGRPHSRASAFLQWIFVGRDFSVMHKTCGSRLAGEGGVSVEMDGTGRPRSRVSAFLQGAGVSG